MVLGPGLVVLLVSAGAAGERHELPKPPVPAQQARVQRVVRNAVVSTRVTVPPYPSRPAVFEFLLEHPDFATRMTGALKLARYRIRRTANGMMLDDGGGVRGDFDVVYRAPGKRMYYARGVRRQPVLPDIHGKAILLIEYEFLRPRQAKPLVATAATAYVKFDNSFVQLIGRLGSALFQARADREARQLLQTFARLAHAIEERPAWVQEQLRQRPDISQQELDEFGRVVRVSQAKSPEPTFFRNLSESLP